MPYTESTALYWCGMGLSMLLCALMSWMLASREEDVGRGKALAFGTALLVLGTVLGLAFARLAWFGIRYEVQDKVLLSLKPAELSYYGGVAGVCAAAVLSALIARIPVRKALNLFAPAGALLAAMARFCEAFLGLLGTADVEMLLGADFPADEITLPAPFAVVWDFFGDGSYLETYFALFVAEGLFALLAMVLSEVHRDGRYRFLRTLFYLCLPQILLESMRSTALAWLFIKVEQLLCGVLAEGVLVWYGIRAARAHRFNFVPAAVGLLMIGAVIAGEFALDGKILEGTPKWMTYGVMALCLAVFAVMEHLGHRRLIDALKGEAPEADFA